MYKYVLTTVIWIQKEGEFGINKCLKPLQNKKSWNLFEMPTKNDIFFTAGKNTLFLLGISTNFCPSYFVRALILNFTMLVQFPTHFDAFWRNKILTAVYQTDTLFIFLIADRDINSLLLTFSFFMQTNKVKL